MKVIGHGVDDDRAVQQVSWMEALVIEGAPGVALVSQKRDQVTGVVRVKLHLRIVMFSCLGKILRAVTGLVDMHGIIIRRAGYADIGKSENLGFHQSSSVGSVIKFYQSADLWRLSAAAHPGCGLRPILSQKLGKGEAGSSCVLHAEYLFLAFAVVYAFHREYA